MKKKIQNGIKRIRGSRDIRVLLTNFGYLSLLQIASYLFPILTLPYLARVIGVESFGKIAFASAIIIWFQTITDWGFNFTATRDISKNRDNKTIVSKLFSNVLWSKCLLMLISFLSLLIVVNLIPTFKENQKIILVTFLIIPGNIMFPSWFFQAIERMKYITILNITSKALFTIAVFVFIKEKSDYILQPLFTSLGFAVSGIVSMYVIVAKWNVKILKPKFSETVKTIKDSTDVFLNELMPMFYNSFSIMLLGLYGGEVATGIFDVGSKFVELTQNFMRIISRTFYPYLSRKIERHQIYAHINTYLSLGVSVLLFLFAPLLIKIFFTPEFSNAVIVLRIMSFSIFLITLSSIYGVNYLIIIGHEKTLRNITITSSIFGFILSIPLVYYFNYIGAAIAIVSSRGILGIATAYFAKKQIKSTYFTNE